MANLPTAHASQTFGHKSVDFYAAPGQVIGSDPRARADERRIQDVDGARHAVRLSDTKLDLSPGDLAAVLRVQPGPARKSRPVAVINYTENTWTRTQPEAGAVLAKAGVARNLNWLATLLFLLAATLVVLWPELRAFARELFPGSLAALPAFDVFAVTANALPDLADWRLDESAAPLARVLEQTVPALAGHAAALLYGLAVALGAIVAFSARSWRLLWVPALVAAIGIGAIGLSGISGAALPAVLALAGVMVFFLVGGAINRARDVWRLEQRIARLADHLLRHPPEEMVGPAGAAAHADSGATTLEAEPQAETAPQHEAPSSLARRSATAAAAAAAAQTAGKAGAVQAGHGEASGASGETAAGNETAPADLADGEADDETARPDSFVAGEAPSPDLREAPVEAQDTAEETETAQADDEVMQGHGGEDPRHAARDISLPPPPPMPRPAETLQPEAPLEEAGIPEAAEDGEPGERA